VVNKVSFSTAGMGHGPKGNFQHGWKGAWSKKLVSVWPERVVVQKVISARLERGVVNKVNFSMAGKWLGVVVWWFGGRSVACTKQGVQKSFET
jgi:hypothetical protein